MEKIKILHMYHDIMNLYGEYGNVKILEKHIKDQGYEVEVTTYTLNDEKIDLKDFDFIYFGTGTERSQNTVLEDIKKYKADIKEYIKNNKMMLCTGNSLEMLGKSIDGREALGIFDFEVTRIKDRIVSDVIYTSKYFRNKVIGFVNKMGVVTHNLNPLFDVEFGVGENEKNDNEGIKYNNLYCTYLIGPFLVRNPEVLQYFVETICESKDRTYKVKKIEYKNEQEAYDTVLDELEKRFRKK